MFTLETAATATAEEIREEDFSCFSDLYKDVHGFRPRGAAAERFNAMSHDEKRAEMNRLVDRLTENESDDLAAEAAALHVWKRELTATASRLGVPLHKAIRWDMQAHECGPHPYGGRRDYQLGYYCFLRGLGSGIESARIVAEAARIRPPRDYGDL